MNLLKKMAGMVFRPSDKGFAETFGTFGISDSGEAINAVSAMQISTVWGCVNLIAGSISTMPVSVRREGADGIPTDVPDHPLNRILQFSPNYDQTPVDFFDFMQSAIELQGDAIARKERGADGRLIGLDPIVPSTVSRRRLGNGRINYRWTKDGRSWDVLDDEVLHIRGPGGDALQGMSTLAFARDTMGLARSAEKTQGRIFRNGIRSTVAVTFDKFLTAEQREIANKNFKTRFAGVENSAEPIILEGGTKLQTLTITPAEAEMMVLRGFTVEELCRFFQTPPVMIGHTSKTTSWPTGVEQQFLLFLKLCLRRRIKRLEMAMEKQLLSPQEYARGLRIRFNFESLLRADSLARAQFYDLMRRNGYTINYIRRLEGLPPVPGGDEIMVQMQDIPLSQAGKQQSEQPPIGQGDDDEQT